MIELVIAERKWRKPGLVARLRRAAGLVLRRHDRTAASLTLLLTDDERLRELNARFRGKRRPTNVLSFPAPPGAYLGDVALAYGVVAREARDGRMSFSDHATHLAVHGVLHLLGYDHDTARDARIMEPLEAEILAKLGISDPYATRA